METKNYIVIFLVILVLLIIFKTSIYSLKKLVTKGEDFLNLEDEMGIYHNNVGSHMRSKGYESTTTTQPIVAGVGVRSQFFDVPDLSEMTGLIGADHVKLEHTNDAYYQLEFDSQIVVYGIFIKAGNHDDSNGTPTFDIKYSLGSNKKTAFIPLLDENNNKKQITLAPNSGHGANATVIEEHEFPVPVTAKYLRVYNTGTKAVNLTIDAIIKPLNYLSLKQYDVQKVNVKQADSTGVYTDSKVDVENHTNFVSHVDNSEPLKPYSDKLGRREIFKFDIRTPHFNFTNLNHRNKTTFDAYIIRSARGIDGEFCHLNKDTKEIYCDKPLRTQVFY